MTSPALSAAPPNALLLWSDGVSLFVELPSPSGPYILRHALTIAGLSAALSLIRTRAYDSGTPPLSPVLPPRNGTLSQHLNASAILRRIRLVP